MNKHKDLPYLKHIRDAINDIPKLKKEILKILKEFENQEKNKKRAKE
ncbi:MAG TPA: hypothetical protein VJJ21_02010 [Candidatus Nanoarchaeia archaeon]|nr:hypothetical protein [Candidatus Nanoarchaeia archaeon]